MAFKDRLLEARQKKGLSRKKLGRLISAGETTIKDWETGSHFPGADKIAALMEALDIDSNFLFQDEATQIHTFSKEERGRMWKIRDLEPWALEMVDTLIDKLLDHQDEISSTMIPLPKEDEEAMNFFMPTYPLGATLASAGTGMMFADDMEEEIRVHRSEVTKKGGDIVIQVRGDSMEPKFSDGDYILVEETPAVYPGEIGVFFINTSVFVKQLSVDGCLHSLNPKYEDIYPGPMDSFKVYGRVLGKVEPADE